MGNFDHSLSGRNGNFVIFTEASGMIEPGESAFHHPSPRKFFPVMRLDFLRNINPKAQLFLCVRDKSTPISSVRAEFSDRRVSLASSLGGRYPTFCIVNIGGVNDNSQQAAQHILYDVPLSALRFFPPSIPRSSLAATVFTL